MIAFNFFSVSNRGLIACALKRYISENWASVKNLKYTILNEKMRTELRKTMLICSFGRVRIKKP